MTLSINEENFGKRLDQFLKKYVDQKCRSENLPYSFSREMVKKYLVAEVLVSGKQRKASYKLRTGDQIVIPEGFLEVMVDRSKLERSEKIVPVEGDLKIIYEDDNTLLLDKAPGIVVHPGVGNRTNTLANHVRYYLEKKGVYDKSLDRAGVVHRLDKPVSGLIIFAKNLASQAFLQSQFEKHEVLKIYKTKVENLPNFNVEKSIGVDLEQFLSRWGDGEELDWSDWHKVEGYIRRDRVNGVKMEFLPISSGKDSRKALSFIKILSEKEKSLLVTIKTGRMHQIRCTLSYLEAPIVGDSLYGKGRGIPRKIELRSSLLGINIPKKGREIFILERLGKS